MTDDAIGPRKPALAPRIADLRQRLDLIRQQARRRMEHGATGLQIATGLSEGCDELVLSLWSEALSACSAVERESLAGSSAIIAVGGSGRAELAPYSDVDLLFLYQPRVEELFARLVTDVVRDCWDAGLKLGHSVRTVRDAVQAARQDIQFATALTESRLLHGSEALLAELMRRFQRHVLRGRKRQFLQQCVAGREAERKDAGGAVLQLEPDIKRSFGGLRDLHLIRWIGFANDGVSDLESLRLRGRLSNDDAHRLATAYDYLMTLRIDLHLASQREDDVLTRDHQLRITEERQIAGTAGQRPVERFMQDYFRHSMTIAEMANRFVARSARPGWPWRIVQFLMTIRIDDIYRVGAGRIDVPRRHQAKVAGSLEEILQLYLTAARYRVIPPDALQERIKQQVPHLSDALSPESRRRFLQFLSTTGKLGALLRSLYHIGVLELVLPAFRHARCLLQFNQYHSYTVDEHTLRTIEIAETFDADRGPIGTAYRDIRHKEILHLALLLHDAGKGFEEDHSEVGRQLALDAADRFQLNDSQRDLLVFLVHRHLLMSEMALRRDASDPQVLLNFSHEVGSPETLKLLFVLTAADITAVGPGVWTGWKAELLTSLYERTMEWLSGQTGRLDVAARLESLRRDVAGRLREFSAEELQRRLDSTPAHYLLSTPSDRIAADLRIVAARQPDDIHIEGRYDAETDTVAYRVITHENVATGCFHKLTGVLTAQRMEILTAGICTCQDGVIIDAFQVVDHDHAGEVPDFRLAEIAAVVRRVLSGQVDVESLIASRRRQFGPARHVGPLSNLPMRVVIDNDWSDRYTIIEVFAHDRPGLLYLLARTIFQLQLSVVRAQISTHFDQVVDAFYVTDQRGRKIDEESTQQAIHDRLVEEIARFEQTAAVAVG